MAADSSITRNCRTYIPAELCEVRGVVNIPGDSDFTEQFIFEKLMIRHSSDYEALLELTGLTEIRRFTKAGENTRYDLDLVNVSFAGTVLPTHVSLCGIIFPVKPYVDPVIQCRKCWRFNHSEKICNRPKLICFACGKPHTGECNLIPKCINCQKLHNATDLQCEKRQFIKKQKIDKAMSKAAKQIIVTSDNITNSMVLTKKYSNQNKTKKPLHTCQ